MEKTFRFNFRKCSYQLYKIVIIQTMPIPFTVHRFCSQTSYNLVFFINTRIMLLHPIYPFGLIKPWFSFEEENLRPMAKTAWSPKLAHLRPRGLAREVFTPVPRRGWLAGTASTWCWGVLFSVIGFILFIQQVVK